MSDIFPKSILEGTYLLETSSPQEVQEPSPFQEEVPSERKITANKLNAQKSSGPKTSVGKSHSRKNAKKHGLLSSEIDSPEHRALLSHLREHYKPFDIVEDFFVQKIAYHMWNEKMIVRTTVGQVDRDRQAAAAELTYNSPDVISAWFKMEHERECLIEEGWQDEGLSNTEEEIVQQMRENLAGVKILQVYMEIVRTGVTTLGMISQYLQTLLRCCCGCEAYPILTSFAQDTVSNEERISKFLKDLDVQDKFLTDRVRCLTAKQESDLRWVSTPHLGADQIVRYDANNSRGLYRAITELERLQSKRLGKAVDPVIRLDVI